MVNNSAAADTASVICHDIILIGLQLSQLLNFAISDFSLILSFAKVQDKRVKGQLSNHYKDNSLTGLTLY